MPPAPGETHLTTLYADVHYYFGDPAAAPLHHRFSRGSYVYLFHDAAERRTKLEVANNVGTVDQDAVFGYLDGVQLTYSYKQPALLTLTVDATQAATGNRWWLNAYDIGNSQKFPHLVQTLDVYLWTEKDAATFLGHLKAAMPEVALDIRDAPTARAAGDRSSHNRGSMSSIVEQLESTAIGSAAFHRAESTVSSSSYRGPPTPATSVGAYASPPTSPPQHIPYNPAAPAAPEPIMHREKTPPPVDGADGTGLMGPPSYQQAPQSQFAGIPSAFGPSGNPYMSGPQPFPAPPTLHQQQPHAPSSTFPGPPAGTPQTNSDFMPGPPPRQDSGPSSMYAGQHQQQAPVSFAPPPTASPPAMQSAAHGSSDTFLSSPSPPTMQYATYAPPQVQSGYASPGLPPPPNAQYGQPMQQQQQYQQHHHQQQQQYQQQQYQQQQQQQQQQQHQQQQQQQYHNTSTPTPTAQAQPDKPQVFAYSGYSYTTPMGQAQAGQTQPAYGAGGAYTGDVHAQVYRPTEAEAKHGHHGKAAKEQQQQGPGPGVTGRPRIEERVGSVEKKVGGFLRKLDRML